MRYEARHSYVIEVKYAKPCASEVEVGRLSDEADARLKRYLSDSKLLPMLAHTEVHPIKLVFHGPKLKVCAQIDLK